MSDRAEQDQSLSQGAAPPEPPAERPSQRIQIGSQRDRGEEPEAEVPKANPVTPVKAAQPKKEVKH